MQIFFPFFLSLILMGLNLNAQNEVTWKLMDEYEQDGIKAWDIDPIGNLIVFAHGTLYKLDQDFNVLFTQSKNSLGEINKIDASHSLKTLLFSENQQMLKFVDNTLTFQEGGADLASLDVDFASLVCYSNQSNMFWVYDELNARLIRMNSSSSVIRRSEISNLTSITGQSSPSSIEENQNQLFLFYKDDGVFVFDYYGSLLHKIDDTLALKVHPTENYVYILRKDAIVKVDRKTREQQTIALPIKGITDFRIFGEYVYFELETGIKKFSLQEKSSSK